MKHEEIIKIVNQLTLEEKAGLCSGMDAWQTKGVERLNIPSIRMSDGPHGLRVVEENNMTGGSEIAVCFPSGCASAASFDRGIMKRFGEALGKECQAMKVNLLLGPGINIKRSPLCGRNFEYYSEDPMLAGELGTAYVEGVQSQGVGTSLKHFFANNQEYRRMDASSEMDERTMREMYLPAFERVIKTAQPWTIMASYNKIGGIYSTENHKYLTELLREEWGYEGMVVSDWGATHSREKAVTAGTDLTMPGEPSSDEEIVKAVQEGRVSVEDVNTACINILSLVYKTLEGQADNIEFDFEEDHKLAREIASDSMVLLKNENNILPLNKDAKIAFIGEFAKKPRFQGGGSSHINSSRVTNAFETATQEMKADVSYTQGYQDDELKADQNLIRKAVENAKRADVAVIFAGLPEKMESEGFDRNHMRMPESHNELIEAVLEVQSNTIVVLHNGSPVEMPWAKKAKGIIETYLGGQAVGEATVDVLFGNVNPSGRLPETFPNRLEDNPSYLHFRGERGKVYYSERMFIGYRYYESKKQEVLYPFGHGLSYTTFSYSNLTLDQQSITIDDILKVSVDISNVGSRKGKEVVQLYVSPGKGEILRPVRELKGFEKVELESGETKTVEFELCSRDFAYWNEELKDWFVESGDYGIQIGRSSHEIVLDERVQMTGNELTGKIQYSQGTVLKEFISHPIGRKVWLDYFGSLIQGLVKTGMFPKEMIQTFQDGSGNFDELKLSVFAERALMPGDENPMSKLMEQPVSLLTMFAPALGANIQEILKKMNE